MESVRTVSILISIILVSIGIGLIIGFKIAANTREKIQGVLRLAYDQDDPGRPAMGLMIESMEYLLSHDTVLLEIEKKNFPIKVDVVRGMPPDQSA